MTECRTKSCSNTIARLLAGCRILLDKLRPRRVQRQAAQSDRKALGAAGEKAVAKLIRRQGSRILERNYTCKRGEIDIIALDRDVVCFVEVKTRRPNSLLPPERNVTSEKRRRIRTIARHYLRARQLRNQVCRFDIAAVTYPEQGPPEIKIIKNAF